MNLRYFEDFEPGETIALGEFTFTEQEIIDFARTFDPQPFHVDKERAKQTMYGGVIASGWHTASVGMRLLFDGLLSQSAGMGSPGVESLTWNRPVRPGDRLSARITILDAYPSQTRLDRGRIRSKFEMLNTNDELVLSWVGIIIIGRRPSAQPD